MKFLGLLLMRSGTHTDFCSTQIVLDVLAQLVQNSWVNSVHWTRQTIANPVASYASQIVEAKMIIWLMSQIL